MEGVSEMTRKSVTVFISALFLFIQITTVDKAYSAPLQKVRLKIEGIHEWSLTHKVELFFCRFRVTTECEEDFTSSTDSRTSAFQRVESALLSVPGVKTVEIRIKKKWFFFKDYNHVYAIVEFELGTLTSETLVMAVESASDAKNIYKVKFIE